MVQRRGESHQERRRFGDDQESPNFLPQQSRFMKTLAASLPGDGEGILVRPDAALVNSSMALQPPGWTLQGCVDRRSWLNCSGQAQAGRRDPPGASRGLPG